jgi:ribosomal protein S18 acetylase RimI-like enzyme
MKHAYINEHSSANVTLSSVVQGIYEVTNVHTDPEHRKQGYATQLMQEICESADAGRDVLMLQCEQTLTKWYARHGFTIIQKSPLLMARVPHIYKTKFNSIAAATKAAINGG